MNFFSFDFSCLPKFWFIMFPNYINDWIQYIWYTYMIIYMNENLLNPENIKYLSFHLQTQYLFSCDAKIIQEVFFSFLHSLGLKFSMSAAYSLFLLVCCFFRTICLCLCCRTHGVERYWILGVLLLGFWPLFNSYLKHTGRHHLLHRNWKPWILDSLLASATKAQLYLSV